MKIFIFSQLIHQLANVSEPDRRRLILDEIRAVDIQRLALLREQTARYTRENDNMERGLELARARIHIQAAMKKWVISVKRVVLFLFRININDKVKIQFFYSFANFVFC